MSEKVYTKIYNTNERIIDYSYCKFHNYDCFGDEDFEICDKGHEIYPEDCEDFKSYKYRLEV